MSKALNQTCRAADYLMARIADLGIKDVFYLPGGGAMYLDDALFCEERLTGVICQHEQACGIAAEANGRTNEAGFGVALVTTGPGATNVLTPVAGAWIESLPMLVVSGQVKRADGLQGRPLRQGGVQEVDVVSMVKPVTKYAVMISNPEDIRYCFEEALWHMRNGRAGPVWLDVPLDVQASPIDPSTLKGFTPPVVSDEADLEQAFKKLDALLANAERPVLLAGHGIRISGAANDFRLLVERLGIPCTFTWNASDLLHWDHPLYVGRPGVVAARAPNLAIQNSDLLISIGCRLDNVVTAYNPKGFARAAKKVVVDIDEHELSRHEMTIDLPLQIDAKEFISQWLKRDIAGQHYQKWIDKCVDWKTRYTPLDGRVFKKDGPISHYQFVDTLSDAIPEDRLVITGSSGLAVEVLYTVYRNKPGQRMFLTSGLGSMGYGLPAAIGACYGADKTPTICVESDGSLMLNLQELVTLKAQNLPIVLIVMNNGGYASIRNTQKNYFNGRYLGTGPNSGLLIPNIVELSKAIGLPATRVTNAKDLLVELQGAIKQQGPFVCEVILESEETLSPKVAAIPQADGSIISMPLEDMSPLLTISQLESEMLVPLEDRSYKARSS
jgi:acetolactate synthase-1/2/3 large subunit